MERNMRFKEYRIENRELVKARHRGLRWAEEGVDYIVAVKSEGYTAYVPKTILGMVAAAHEGKEEFGHPRWIIANPEYGEMYWDHYKNEGRSFIIIIGEDVPTGKVIIVVKPDDTYVVFNKINLEISEDELDFMTDDELAQAVEAAKSV